MTKPSCRKIISYHPVDEIGRPEPRGERLDFITLPFVQKPFDQLRILFHINAEAGEGGTLQEIIGHDGEVRYHDGPGRVDTSHELFCKDRRNLIYDRNYATDKGIVVLSLKFLPESGGRYLTLHQKFPHKPEIVRHFGCL